ncbi:hypothetical protein OAA64_01250 [bacterium]|nr:hypothetical protein [bacterium]
MTKPGIKALNVVPDNASSNKSASDQYSNLASLNSRLRAMDAAIKDYELKETEVLAEALYGRTLTIADFYRRFAKSNETVPFLEKILFIKSDQDFLDIPGLVGSQITEVIISIPMITGMLPYPDFSKIDLARFALGKAESFPGYDTSKAADKKKIEEKIKKDNKYKAKIIKEGKIELDKMSLYPKAYKLVKATQPPSRKDIVKVLLPNKLGHFPSFFALEYVGKADKKAQKKEGQPGK